MTDYGTIAIVSYEALTSEVSAFAVAMAQQHYSTMTPQSFDFSVVPGIGSYALAGTLQPPPCPDCPELPGVPTEGIIWPTPGVVAVDSSVNQEVRAASDATYSYLGTAMEGTAESATSWAITRITPVSPPVVKEAVGAWTNRAALTYT